MSITIDLPNFTPEVIHALDSAQNSAQVTVSDIDFCSIRFTPIESNLIIAAGADLCLAHSSNQLIPRDNRLLGHTEEWVYLGRGSLHIYMPVMYADRFIEVAFALFGKGIVRAKEKPGFLSGAPLCLAAGSGCSLSVKQLAHVFPLARCRF